MKIILSALLPAVHAMPGRMRQGLADKCIGEEITSMKKEKGGLLRRRSG